MKKILLIVVILGVIGCGNTNKENQQEYTESERLANCVEDTIDTIEIPDGLSTMEEIDYASDEANEKCILEMEK